MDTIQDFAATARAYFVEKKRTNGDMFWFVADEAPEWVRDLCYVAHDFGSVMAEDWRYQFIVDALDAFEECDDPDDVLPEAPHTVSEKTAWLASRNDRYDYVDEAVRELGHGESIIDDIAMGMEAEMREVFDSVRSSLEEMIENDDNA